MPSATDPAVLRDVEQVRRIESVRTALELLCESTGCRIALIARVTSSTWNVCEVLDQVGFGLKPGDALELANTF